jgi:hypothetical protein
MSGIPGIRRGRSLALLLSCFSAAALTSAAPASADDTGSARDAFRQAAEAGSQDVPQVAQRPMLRASAGMGPQGVTASNLFLDTPFDSSLAPDLQQMLALTSDDARYTVGITLDTNALIEGDVVMTFVNTDGNAAASAWSAGGRPTPGAAATAGRRSRGRRS